MNEFLILLQAKLDEASLKGIKGNLDELRKEFAELKIKPVIDEQALNVLAGKINKLFADNGVKISNIGIDTSGLNKSGQKAADDLSNGMSQGLKKSSNILNSFKKSLENMGMGSKEIDSIATKICNLGVQIESLNQTRSAGKVDTLSVNIAGIDEYGQAIKLTQQYNAVTGELINTIDNVSTVQQKAGSTTEAFIEKQQKAIASARNTLSTIEAKLNDSNITKSLASTDFDSNGLNTQLDRVRTSISALENASRDTFTQAQIDVNKEITSLNNLITTLKNAEYAATSLRTKDINTVKIDEDNNLNTFVQKMEQSGHYTDELKQKVENLRTQLNGVFDASTLTSYLNSLSNLESEFKSVDATAKTLEKSTKLQTNIEAEKKILQVYTNKLKEAGVLTDDVKEKIQNMFYSLSKVDSQNGLTTWRAELKGVKTETDAVLKSVLQEKSEEEKLANTMATVREKTEQTRKTEEQRQQLAQNNAINKALEQEYQERLKVAEVTKTQANKIQLSMDTGEYESKVNALIGKTQQWTDKNGEARISTSSLSDALYELKVASNEYANNPSESTQKRLIDSNKKLDAEYRKVTNSIRSMNAEIAKDSAVSSLHNQISDFISKNGKAVKYFGADLNYIFEQTAQGSKLSNEELTKLKQKFIEIQNTARNTGKLGKTFFQTLKEGISYFSYWTSSTFLVMQSITKIRQAFGELKEVNTILTEISKTSELTAQQLEQLGNISFETASKYGKSASDYLTGVQEMYRAGFQNAEQLAELSTLAQSAGDLDADLANDYIIASDAAYGYAGNIEKLTALLDSQNQVTNRNAVSMEELANATKVAANQLSNSNISENEMTALLGTGIATSREAGETVGRALKGIIMNLQQVKGETGFDGEIIDEESLAKVEARCHSVGVELEYMKDGIARLRNPMEIMKELAEVYNSLPDDSADKAGIIADIGGKYRGNVFSSILSNWDKVEKMLGDYENATGSAMEEAMKSANNWEGSLNRLKNTWTDTVGNIANSDVIITIINAFNSLISVLNKVTEMFDSFGTIGLGAGLFAGWKNVGKPKMFGFNYCLNMPTVC